MTQWQPGMRMTAGRLQAISPYPQTWVPVWTTSTGVNVPSFGNASLDCSYSVAGGLVVAHFNVAFGSTTSFTGATDSDNWQFSLPVPTSEPGSNAIGHFELAGSNANRLFSLARVATSTSFELYISGGAPDGAAIAKTGLVDALSPWTWESGDSIKGTLTYPAAL